MLAALGSTPAAAPAIPTVAANEPVASAAATTASESFGGGGATGTWVSQSTFLWL